MADSGPPPSATVVFAIRVVGTAAIGLAVALWVAPVSTEAFLVAGRVLCFVAVDVMLAVVWYGLVAALSMVACVALVGAAAGYLAEDDELRNETRPSVAEAAQAWMQSRANTRDAALNAKAAYSAAAATQRQQGSWWAKSTPPHLPRCACLGRLPCCTGGDLARRAGVASSSSWASRAQLLVGLGLILAALLMALCPREPCDACRGDAVLSRHPAGLQGLADLPCQAVSTLRSRAWLWAASGRVSATRLVGSGMAWAQQVWEASLGDSHGSASPQPSAARPPHGQGHHLPGTLGAARTEGGRSRAGTDTGARRASAHRGIADRGTAAELVPAGMGAAAGSLGAPQRAPDEHAPSLPAGKFAVGMAPGAEPDRGSTARPHASAAGKGAVEPQPDDAGGESGSGGQRRERRMGVLGGVVWLADALSVAGAVGEGAVDEAAEAALLAAGAARDALSVGGRRAAVLWPACLRRARDAESLARRQASSRPPAGAALAGPPRALPTPSALDPCAGLDGVLLAGRVAAALLLAGAAALLASIVPLAVGTGAAAVSTVRLLLLLLGPQPPDSIYGAPAPDDSDPGSREIALLTDPDPLGLALITQRGGAVTAAGALASRAALRSLLWSVAVRTHAVLGRPSGRAAMERMDAAVDRLRRGAARVERARAAGQHLRAAGAAVVAAVSRSELAWPPEGIAEEDAGLLLEAATTGLRHARYFDMADDPFRVKKLVAELFHHGTDDGSKPQAETVARA